MNKYSLAEVAQRILVRPNPQEGILSFGEGNIYPQVTDNAIKGSGRATQCVDTYGKFARGGGMKIPFYKTVVNSMRLTIDKLHRKLVDDYKKHKGVVIHFNYNMLGEKTSLNIIPFKECRLGINKDKKIDSIVHHPDWGRESGQNFMKDQITRYNLYNPDPDIINREAEAAGGFAFYKGQAWYYGKDGELKYPESSIDPVLEDVLADYDTKIFRKNNIGSGFLASHIFRHPKFDNDADRNQYLKNLKKFQGSNNTSKIFDVEEPDPNNSSFKVEKVEIQDMDGLFINTENSVLEAIRRNFGMLPVLLGDLVSGKMGTSQEIKDAYDFENSITADDRLLFEEIFTECFRGWHDENVNPENDYSIIPLAYLISATAATSTPNANPAPAN